MKKKSILISEESHFKLKKIALLEKTSIYKIIEKIICMLYETKKGL